MLRIRPARASDLDALFDFAERVGPGMTTLPANHEALAQKIAVSAESFAGQRSGAGAAYVLLLEDAEQGAIHGSAAVYPEAGADFGFFSYKRARLKQRSDVLAINREIPVLNLVNDLTGWTEVGSLVVAPQGRRGGFGRRLARSRYLLIAQFPELFSEDVFAEMRGWQDEDGRSPFWTAVGQRFFDLDFSAADRLSALEGSRFIQELMPKHPIYLQLLAEEARDCVGRPHASSRAAMDLLLKEGFRYEGYVDVFDAGPQVQARRGEIATVRDSRVLAVRPGAPEGQGGEVLASRVDLADFIIGWGEAQIAGDGIVLSQALRRTLEVVDGDVVRACPWDGQAREQNLGSGPREPADLTLDIGQAVMAVVDRVCPRTWKCSGMDFEGPVLETVLAASRRRPPVIVFGDRSYSAILANWAADLRTVSDAEVVVMAMDHHTGLHAKALGLRSCAFPVVTELADLWIKRAALFAALARSGLGFIHSDADAIWLDDPIEYISALGADLAFSPGTVWPPEVVRDWGFVVCCGLFFAQGGPVAGDFFSEVAERARAERDDQSAVNRTLAAWKAQWRRPSAGTRQMLKGEAFNTFEQPVCGEVRGLKLALLPERLFPRLEARAPQAMVAHPLLPKSASAKQAGLIRLGLWTEADQGDLGH